MANTVTQIAYPEWTEYRKKNGLDPLGMQTSSIGLYQNLLPGISNVTLRIRYYGFYAWLCHIYAQKIGDTNPKIWQRFIRRAEALYALVAQKHGGENGVAGIQWAEKTLQEAESKVIDFAAAAEPGSDSYYLKQAWGAYGAAYASQLYEVGIYGDAEGHEIPVPSPERGFPLASAFADVLGPLAAKFFQIVQRGSVTRDNLDALASIRPSAISENSSERDWYEKILFAQGGLDRPRGQERRRTLLIILYLSSQIGPIPEVIDVRWMLYTGRDLNGNPLAYESAELAEHRLRWWIYQANDLTHIAYETLLKYVLDLLEPHPGGLTLESLIGEAVQTIRSVADDWPKTWESFLLQNATDDLNAEETLSTAARQEARRDRICSPQGAWDALKLLAVVQNRSRAAAKNIRNELEKFNPAVFQSLLTEVHFLESLGSDDFARTVSKLMEQRIIRRHLWVALRKLRYQGDYTFLIESDDGRIRLRSKDGPIFTNPRLGPAITFLKDIHLIDTRGLTEKGRKVLNSA